MSFRTCWYRVEKFLVAGEREIIHTKSFFFPCFVCCDLIWLRVVGMVFLLVKVSRGEMSLGVRIRVSSRPQHPRVLCFPHRHQ
ncbi:hypothetical protein Taro_001021 [Colocasia esculenta]|uniref:Uncharacterized protein n=1 Tax=Colocasia esculenta TaxID=4460 RepID=A0A843TJE3_COLES|nr:hypothetical protein [Colocasia esculenta]